MALTLDIVKQYLRVDVANDDELIQSIMATASAYMHGAVDDYEKTRESDAKFASLGDMAELAVIAERYENRNAYGQDAKDYSYTVRSIIAQLQNWSGTADESGEGSDNP